MNFKKENPFLNFVIGISRKFALLIVIAMLVLLLPVFLPENYKIETIGALGDTFGGFVNPIVGMVAALLTFLAFYVQYLANNQVQNQFKVQQFESQFYEMIRLYRANVNEMKYIKYKQGDPLTYENRQVINIIFNEFLECYGEIKKFHRDYKFEKIIKDSYLPKLTELSQNSDSRINVDEFALIDIAYSIVYFGVGDEGNAILRLKFKNRYESHFYFRLIQFLKLKPKKSNKKRFKNWRNFRGLDSPKFHELIEEIYQNKNKMSKKGKLSKKVNKLEIFGVYEKYYGGHQFRLGHYFRHLFQSFKFIDEQNNLSEPEKYSYAKMMRAQLSYYEQALLFVNSVSHLGMKWELDSEFNPISGIKPKYITRYNLIKNLQGSHFNGVKFKRYYPDISYEN
jgi:hypothetical protein